MLSILKSIPWVSGRCELEPHEVVQQLEDELLVVGHEAAAVDPCSKTASVIKCIIFPSVVYDMLDLRTARRGPPPSLTGSVCPRTSGRPQAASASPAGRAGTPNRGPDEYVEEVYDSVPDFGRK